MCSLAESDLPSDDTLSECSVDTSSSLDPSLCKKCRTSDAELTLRLKDRYCRQCFVSMTHHKFRATLAKNRALRHNENVLVCFDGGQNSVAMMKMINTSLDEKNVKRVSYSPRLLIIVDESTSDFAKVIESVKQFGHEAFYVHLEDGLDEDAIEPRKIENENAFVLKNLSRVEKLKSTLASMSDETSRQFFVQCLKKIVVLKCAQILGCSKVFSSECSNDLAVTIIAGVATGRGNHLVNDAGFQDSSSSAGVQILRPMKEFSDEEIKIFNDGDDVIVNFEDNSTNSIFKLTETFVSGLQSGFPATIPTICRTGDKLSKSNRQEDDFCVLCGGNLDTKSTTTGCTALDATRFSKAVSSKGASAALAEAFQVHYLEASFYKIEIESGCQKDDCCREENESCCQSSKLEMSTEEFQKQLCYGCRIVTYNMPVLPESLTNEARRRIQRQKMKSEIEDFLL